MDETKVFLKYLENRKILIADTSSSSRSGLFNVFRDLGVKPSQIILVNSYNQAQQIIESDNPPIVLAEYELGKRCGLELFQVQREKRPDATKTSLFLIVTGNTSQTAVARSAEEEIDAYILKPYTPETVRKIIIKTAVEKIKPSSYRQAIDEAKKLIKDQKLDEAEGHLKRAVELDSSPALAHYYLGQIKYFRKVLAEAQGSYESGLKLNKIHYKCMIGLYELLMDQKQHHHAYDVVKRISQYFPANPKRLAEVLKLAITTGKYEDIEKYYQVFINIDERDELLIKYVCAALLVCGKYYLTIDMGQKRALELFTKASATGARKPTILKEIINALVDRNLGKDAATFLTKYAPEHYSTDDYILMKLLVSNATGANAGLIIEEGRALIKKGVKDYRLHAAVLERLYQTKLTAALSDVKDEAYKLFPQKKDFFDALIKRLEAKKAA